MNTKKERPKIRPPRKIADRIFESLAIACVLYGLFIIIQAWPTLPQTIPTHFDASGNPDGFGSKGTIWLLPAISVVMVPAILFFRRYPWLSNVPWEINEENALRQYELLVRLFSLCACVISFIFLVLAYDTISIASGGSSLFGKWLMPVFIVPPIGILIWYLIAGWRAR